MRRRLLVPAYIFWPIAYLATLACGMILLWWTILIGGNPYEIRNIATLDARGEVSKAFRPGDLVGVRRRVCTDIEIGAHIYPALKNDKGFVFPLPSGIAHQTSGCRHSTYGFVMPALPPGHYTYVSTALFQNNLVGRDEFAPYPPLHIEVLP